MKSGLTIPGMGTVIEDRATILQPDPSTPPRRVYVVEDEDVQRYALHNLLDAAGFEVTSFLSAEALLQRVANLPGGCIVTDLIMPGKSGLELQHLLLDRWKDFRLILISAGMDTSTTVKATRAGAVAVLDKPVRYEVLETAVEEALMSLQFGAIPSCQFCDITKHVPPDEMQSRPLFGGFTTAELQQLRKRFALLTEREVQVAALVCNGLTNREIGQQLGISSRTVEKHRAKAMTKLQVRTIADFTLAMATLRSLNPAA